MIRHSIDHLKIFETTEILNHAVAHYIIAVAKKAMEERGRFILVLSGGETPKGIYSLLAEPSFSKQMQWEKTFVFWGDERCVPLNDKRNNAHQAQLLLFSKIDIPVNHIYPIPVNLLPVEAADQYEKDVKLFFGDDPIQFDLLLLGLGENGHTASLFPGTSVLAEEREGIREVFSKEEQIFRITMTAPMINCAHRIVFLVTGEKKATILKRVIESSSSLYHYPAELIKPKEGELHWYVDQPAASLLTN